MRAQCGVGGGAWKRARTVARDSLNTDGYASQLGDALQRLGALEDELALDCAVVVVVPVLAENVVAVPGQEPRPVLGGALDSDGCSRSP